MHPISFVFDIDDTLVLHFEESEWKNETREVLALYGKEFLQEHTVWAIDYPHFIFPGILTLWKWLHGMGHRLAMFSSAVPERNEELADKLTTMVFGDQATEIRKKIKVLSRKDLFDTYHTNNQRAYQPIYFGNYKKVLKGVAVLPRQMPWTFLIDDDTSYMALHEEYNFIKVRSSSWLLPLSAHSFREDAYFFKAFYLAGLFKRIFDKIRANHVTAVEAAKVIQIDNTGVEFDPYFDYPTIEDITFYEEGERILSSLNPDVTIPLFIKNRMKNKDYKY